MSTPKTAKARHAELRDMIIVYFLETGNAASVKDLAGRFDRSESWIRKALEETHHMPEGTTLREEHRATYSRNYPGMRHGARKVTVYRPTVERLRQMVVADGGGMTMPKAYDAEGNPTAW